MNRAAVIFLSTGSFLLAICVILTVIFRVFHVRFCGELAYTGVVCLIAGMVVLVTGLYLTKKVVK
jgi:hypothetical protein